MGKGQLVNIDEVISKATKEAIKEFNKEQKDCKRKKVFHNTRLLLRHYNDLNESIDNAISDVNQIESSLDEGLNEDELYIWSIKKSKIKTLIMIAHIDAALESLKNKQEKLGFGERYKALEMYYLQNKSYEDIQEQMHCGINTPKRWINSMIDELSIFLFGVDGLKL